MEVGAGLSDFMRETGFGGCPLTIAAKAPELFEEQVCLSQMAHPE